MSDDDSEEEEFEREFRESQMYAKSMAKPLAGPQLPSAHDDGTQSDLQLSPSDDDEEAFARECVADIV
jgi:hypothetical protein